MDMVALMLKVEAEFDLALPQPEITPENFQSVKTLERLILNQLGPDGMTGGKVYTSTTSRAASRVIATSLWPELCRLGQVRATSIKLICMVRSWKQG